MTGRILLSKVMTGVQGSPVMAKAFEKPLTVRVRGHMPGRAAKEWCAAG